MSLHSGEMDWELIGEYFQIFDMEEVFSGLKRKYHAV
jgi:hypothetical protein